MSNEIQLALNQGQGLAQPGGWGGPLGSGGPQPPTPLKKVHRLLRGRYIVAVALASMFAVAFAAAGFLLPKPAYKSEATIEIDSTIPIYTADQDKVMQQQTQFVQGIMLKLTDERVALAAMEDPRWKSVNLPTGPAALEKFKKNLVVEQPPRTSNFITVSYTDNGKAAKDQVQMAVSCVIKAYKEIYGQDENKGIDEKIAALNTESNRLELEMQGLRHDTEVWGKDGADDPLNIRARDETVVGLHRQIQDAEELLKQAEDDLDAASKAAGGRKFTVEDFARVDVTMAGQVKARDDKQLQIDGLKSQLGPRNAVVISNQAELDARAAHMAKYADELNERYVIRWRIDGAGGTLIPKDLGNLRASLKRTVELYNRESGVVSDMRDRQRKIAQANNRVNEKSTRVKEIYDQLRNLSYIKEHAVHTKYLGETGTQASLDKDRRPVYAALGFMGGAGLPIGVMLLIGMFDSRYRYSDDTDTAMQGMTLLGILPNLPDRLSDPEQAGIAAHCVHQIRTMLQINGSPDERRVFAVTSASPGDGKTSLTLALGLSYAACGTRTLLIDCDLIGAGLTARMNVSAAEGVLEAIANRQLLPYVRTTDIADVAILPVGSAGTMHASTLSPAALRRLVEEAEKHFETILIDTGPILGSIEASLVCAAADATVLTVSRGQQRPMVEKSLSHLAAIGARLAGVVFNRAQAHDFERSISGASMRSVGIPGASRGRGAQVEPGHRFGPVARAVAAQGPAAEMDDDEAGDDGEEQE